MRLRRCCSERISSRISRRRRASRLDSGSSNSSTAGSSTRARASATRCCWPPDSSLGSRVVEADQAHVAQRIGGALARRVLGTCRHLQAVGHVLQHVHVREQRVALEHHAHVALGGPSVVTSLPSMRIWPEVGDSRPAIMRSVVVLPQPEGPRMVVSVPVGDGEADALDGQRRGGGGAVALGDVAKFDAGIVVSWVPAPRLRRPSLRSPTRNWISRRGQRHENDQHRAVRQRHAVVAVAHAADDVGGRQFVLGRHQEDHRRHRGDGAHEAVDQRGDQRRLEQRQHHMAQGLQAARRAASARLRRATCPVA